MWKFLLKKIPRSRIAMAKSWTLNFNYTSVNYSGELVYIYACSDHTCSCHQPGLCASLPAGRAGGGVAGEDAAWQWLDTQRPAHHSFLAPRWPQAPLHNPRPQVGNPCALMNSAAMNTGVHVSLSILVSSVCMPSSGIAGLYGNSISSFLRDLHTVLHSESERKWCCSVMSDSLRPHGL